MMNPEGKEKAGPPPSLDKPYGFNPPPYSQAVPAPGSAPPGPASVQYAQGPATATTIQVTTAPALGPLASRMVCPSCHADITTKVEAESSTKTHGIALLMCICGLWPCCLIPYFMDSCKNTNHYCPSCNAFLGQYKR